MSSYRHLSRILGQRRARYLALGGVLGAAGIGGMKARPGGGGNGDAVSEAVSGVMVELADELGLTSLEAGFHTTDWDLPNLDHARVEYWIDRFMHIPAMYAKMEGFLERSGRYVPMISEKLAQRGMPQDLVFLAMIESGFEPGATSSAAATGIWQFIAETGRRYGLRVDRTIDERRDPEKATDAALDYLSELYDRFGSWYLAAAAYNSGENRVGRIMRENFGREQARSEEDYYRIWDRLPKETRDYVPLMIAAGRIVKDLEGHGFAHVVPDGPEVFDVVLGEPGLSLSEIADRAAIPIQALRDLNPHLIGGSIPSGQQYSVRVPVGAGERVAGVLDRLAGRPVDQ